MIQPGAAVMVFDNKLWNGKDVGNNSQFFKEALILRVYKTKPSSWSPEGEEVAEVRFLHDNRVSKGHFTNGMRECPESSTAVTT